MSLSIAEPSGRHLVQLVWSGRFGNRMFAYLYGCAYAARTGGKYWMPSAWEGSRLFAAQPAGVLPPGSLCARLSDQNSEVNARKVQEAQEWFPGLELVDAEELTAPFALPAQPIAHANSCMYNPRILAGISRAEVRQWLSFSELVKATEAYRHFSERAGTYDVAHLRRDDIANPAITRLGCAHSVVSRDSYLRAFNEQGVDPSQIVWVSDDYTRKWHQDRTPTPRAGYFYPTGSQYLPGLVFDWLADFLCLYFARRIFRANSSFSWWAATLAPEAQVYSPVIDAECIYGVDGYRELEVRFVAGNHPHWTYNCPELRLANEV